MIIGYLEMTSYNNMKNNITIFLPVQDAQTKISNQKNQDLMPDELVDAALPPQQEVPNTM